MSRIDAIAPASPRMIELVHVGREYTRGDGQKVAAVDDVSLVVPERSSSSSASLRR